MIPDSRAALIELLAVWQLNLDDRLSIDNEFGQRCVSMKTAKHSGDCTKSPWSCSRCIAEEAIQNASTILDALAAHGLAVVPVEPTEVMLGTLTDSLLEEVEIQRDYKLLVAAGPYRGGR